MYAWCFAHSSRLPRPASWWSLLPANRADHRQAPGALLPAAWERAFAPSAGLSSSPYRPLVYAVSGVDDHGQTLANAQPQSQAPMAAYGDHAALADDGSGTATAHLTGSSVAAVVVSAAAAAAWSYAPWLDAAEVMDEVYRSGDLTTASPPDLCLPDPEAEPCATARPTVRRISVCKAVDRVCSFTEGCPPPFDTTSPSPCPPWPTAAVDLGEVDLSPFVPAAVSTLSDLALISPISPLCTLTSFFDSAGAPPADPCPSWQLNGAAAAPWVHPQPGSTPCPNCPLIHGVLSIAVDDSIDGILREPALIACGVSLSLPVPDLGTDLPTTHQVEGIEPPPGCTSGLLAFTHLDPEGEISSTVSPIRITP